MGLGRDPTDHLIPILAGGMVWVGRDPTDHLIPTLPQQLQPPGNIPRLHITSLRCPGGEREIPTAPREMFPCLPR